MKFNEKMFHRDVDHSVQKALFLFIEEMKGNGLDFKTSVIFSDFISLSSKCSYDHRYSISELSQIFNDYKFPTSDLLKIYMVALLCLQKNKGKKFIW